MATVYIETTIPSYYHETRRTPQARAWRDATREWWKKYRHHYQLQISEYVLAELSLAPPHKASAALGLIHGLPLLPEPAELEEVVAYYIDHRLMPADAGGDAAHLAMASLHRIDYLLTWNIRHLANVNKIQHLSVLNARLGLPVPIITTPLTLAPEKDE